MLRKFLFIGFLLLGANLAAAAPTPSSLLYDTVGTRQLSLDLYQPSQPGLHPALVFVHGGCFNQGSKADVPPEAVALVNDGFAVFSVDYRLSTEALYPAGLTDVQQAVRFIRKNAAFLQVDPNRIVAYGQSAGAYLASALGVRPLPSRTGAIDANSARVPFVIDWFGRVDFTRSQTTGVDCAESFLGLQRNATTMPRFLEASLQPYVDANSAQFFIAQGTADQQVDPAHSILLAQTLKAAGRPVQLEMFQGQGHGFTIAQPWIDTRAFLLSNLH